MNHPIYGFCLVLFVLIAVPNDTAISQTDFWQPTNGPNDGAITRLAINSKGHLFAICNNLHRSTDDGSTWTQLNTFYPTSNGSVTFQLGTLAVAPNDYLIGGSYGAIYLSTDNGDTWQKSADVYDWYTQQLYSVTSFTVTPDSVIYAGTWGQGLYFSENFGYSWYGGGYNPLNVGDNFVSTLTTSTSGDVIVGTDRWISNYNGRIWSDAQFSMYGTFDIASITGSPRGYLFASSSVGILRSSQDSGYFYPMNNGLSGTHFYGLLVNSGGMVFAGSDSGVFRSTDDGNSWLSTNSGLTDLHVTNSALRAYNTLAVNSAGYLFVGTQSGLVFKSTQPTVTSAPLQAGNPLRTFALDQNYPNPFNPSTRIRYSITDEGMVRLAVFNMLGQEVERLVSDMKQPGEYEAKFDGKNLPSGIYFYRLETGSHSVTKKMLLLR
jgi:photosystem II stability/assembly factor-like uncharacterized protein